MPRSPSSPAAGVVLGTAIFDQGSGTHTTLQQVVAEELRAPLHRIRLEVWDTEPAPSTTRASEAAARRA